MALKGTTSKQIATNKILELFEGSFINDKEIRIPMVEDGVEIQLKCAITCAKTNVIPGAAEAIPGEDIWNFEETPTPAMTSYIGTSKEEEPVKDKMTDAEKANIKNLMSVLGL